MLIVIKEHVTQRNNEGFGIVDNKKPYRVIL